MSSYTANLSAKKGKNEDIPFSFNYKTDLAEFKFNGVFDGHGGDQIAIEGFKIIDQLFGQKILELKEISEKILHIMMNQVIFELNTHLRKFSSKSCSRCGSVYAGLVYVNTFDKKEFLVLSNVGDAVCCVKLFNKKTMTIIRLADQVYEDQEFYDAFITKKPSYKYKINLEFKQNLFYIKSINQLMRYIKIKDKVYSTCLNLIDNIYPTGFLGHSYDKKYNYCYPNIQVLNITGQKFIGICCSDGITDFELVDPPNKYLPKFDNSKIIHNSIILQNEKRMSYSQYQFWNSYFDLINQNKKENSAVLISKDAVKKWIEPIYFHGMFHKKDGSYTPIQEYLDTFHTEPCSLKECWCKPCAYPEGDDCGVSVLFNL